MKLPVETLFALGHILPFVPIVRRTFLV